MNPSANHPFDSKPPLEQDGWFTSTVPRRHSAVEKEGGTFPMRAMSMNHRDGKRELTLTRQELMMNKLEPTGRN